MKIKINSIIKYLNIIPFYRNLFGEIVSNKYIIGNVQGIKYQYKKKIFFNIYI
jgi:hypothetical protein